MEEVVGNFDTLFDTPFDTPVLARLRRPMLFLAGARTVSSARRLFALLRDAFPAAHHEVLPDMGHMGPVTHPEPVNERIEQFLNHCERNVNGPDRESSTRRFA
jgi:pimeloyl-ACP methyl ester carboxylesterase